MLRWIRIFEYRY